MTTQSNDSNSMLFAYVRVSTKEQNVDSQLSDISKLYPDAEITTEKVSGTVPAKKRGQGYRFFLVSYVKEIL